jgi:hypothetical protein
MAHKIKQAAIQAALGQSMVTQLFMTSKKLNIVGFFTYILFLGFSIVFAEDYPWKNISSVFVTTELHYHGFSSLESKCSCNCDSGLKCEFVTFKSNARDNDLCFWKDLLDKSNPKYIAHSPGVGFACGEPPIVINIRIINSGKDTLNFSIETINPKYLSTYSNTANGKRGKWEFYLGPEQCQLIKNKLNKIFECGVGRLIDSFKNAKHGC